MNEWADSDEVTITYRTMKQMISEAQEAEREKIIAHLESAFAVHVAHTSAEHVDDNWNYGFKRAVRMIREMGEQ